MDGAVIGAGSIVAGGALVPEGKIFPPNSIIAGVPAKQIAERDNTHANRLKCSPYWQWADLASIRPPAGDLSVGLGGFLQT